MLKTVAASIPANTSAQNTPILWRSALNGTPDARKAMGIATKATMDT
jgi:hypothetical protein